MTELVELDRFQADDRFNKFVDITVYWRKKQGDKVDCFVEK